MIGWTSSQNSRGWVRKVSVSNSCWGSWKFLRARTWLYRPENISVKNHQRENRDITLTRAEVRNTNTRRNASASQNDNVLGVLQQLSSIFDGAVLGDSPPDLG